MLFYLFNLATSKVRFLVICSQRKIKTFIISLNHVRDFKFHDVTLHVFL